MSVRRMLEMGGLVAVLAIAVLAAGCAKKPAASTDVTAPGDGSGNGPGAGGDGSGADRPGADESAAGLRLDDVFFDYDKYELRGDARSVLQGNARYLKETTGLDVVLEGHCDERGTNEYNLALGQRRADAVRAYLVDLGVAGSRLSTVSYGEERPFAMGSTEDAWGQNRRVHFNPSGR